MKSVLGDSKSQAWLVAQGGDLSSRKVVPSNKKDPNVKIDIWIVTVIVQIQAQVVKTRRLVCPKLVDLEVRPKPKTASCSKIEAVPPRVKGQGLWRPRSKGKRWPGIGEAGGGAWKGCRGLEGGGGGYTDPDVSRD